MDYLNLKNKDSKWESVFSDNCLEYPKEKIITPLESFLEKEFDDKYLIGEKTLQARIKGCDRYGENNMPKFVKELIGKFLKNGKSDFDYGPSLFLVRQGNPVGGGKGFLECDYIPTLTTSLTAIIFYAVKGGRIFFRKLTINERAKAQGFQLIGLET